MTSLWTKLLGISSIGFGIASQLLPDKVGHALKDGFVLAGLDAVIETLGEIAGFWASKQSQLKVGAAPIEVLGTAVTAGAGWSLLLPKIRDATASAIYILGPSAVCTMFERYLIEQGYLEYMKGWTSIHAFFAYLLTMLGLHEIHYRLR